MFGEKETVMGQDDAKIQIPSDIGEKQPERKRRDGSKKKPKEPRVSSKTAPEDGIQLSSAELAQEKDPRRVVIGKDYLTETSNIYDQSGQIRQGGRDITKDHLLRMKSQSQSEIETAKIEAAAKPTIGAGAEVPVGFSNNSKLGFFSTTFVDPTVLLVVQIVEVADLDLPPPLPPRQESFQFGKGHGAVLSEFTSEHVIGTHDRSCHNCLKLSRFIRARRSWSWRRWAPDNRYGLPATVRL